VPHPSHLFAKGGTYNFNRFLSTRPKSIHSEGQNFGGEENKPACLRNRWKPSHQAAEATHSITFARAIIFLLPF
jgi:hypothetical protein